VKARLYFGHAENDQSMPGEAIEKLEWALQSWAGSYESEMYSARHGWMIPGREVHNPNEAVRGFAKRMELFDDTLRSPAVKAV
jgi:carboxymethylenebutenolidase